MEEIKFDREAFAKQQQRRAAGPSLATSIGGLILLFITLGVVGGGGYWFLKTRGMAPELPEIKLPALGGIGHSDTNDRLAEMDLRLAAIEKRLNITPPKPNSKPSALGANSSRGNQSSGRSRTAAASTKTSAVVPSAGSATSVQPDSSGIAHATSKNEQVAQQEAWEATADRLGMAVGQLGDQRREIARTQDDLVQLRQKLERNSLPFQLWKNGGRYRVGPISMKLQDTDRKHQRYDLMLYFDDRAVQMKDRALGERVEFYIQGSEQPLELVVSDILPDRVSGKLAVPVSYANSLSR